MKTPIVRPYNYRFLQTYLASPHRICGWNHTSASRSYFLDVVRLNMGEVTAASTYDYKNLKPTVRGLFCETIFGILGDKRSRRSRPGHIKLASPVMHVWFLKGSTSYASLLTNRKRKHLEQLVYANGFTPHANGSFGCALVQHIPVNLWQDSHHTESKAATPTVTGYHVNDLVSTGAYGGRGTTWNRRPHPIRRSLVRHVLGRGDIDQLVPHFLPWCEPVASQKPVKATDVKRRRTQAESSQTEPIMPMSPRLNTLYYIKVYPYAQTPRVPYVFIVQAKAHCRAVVRVDGPIFVSDAWQNFYFEGPLGHGLEAESARAKIGSWGFSIEERTHFRVSLAPTVHGLGLVFDNGWVPRPRPSTGVDPVWRDFCRQIKPQAYEPCVGTTTGYKARVQDDRGDLSGFYRQKPQPYVRNGVRRLRAHAWLRGLIGFGLLDNGPRTLDAYVRHQVHGAQWFDDESGWAKYLRSFARAIGAKHLSLNVWYNVRRPVKPTRLASCKNSSICGRRAWHIAHYHSDVAYSPFAPARTMPECVPWTRRSQWAYLPWRKTQPPSMPVDIAKAHAPTGPGLYARIAAMRLKKYVPRHPLASEPYANWVRREFMGALKVQAYSATVKRRNEAEGRGEKRTRVEEFRRLAYGLRSNHDLKRLNYDGTSVYDQLNHRTRSWEIRQPYVHVNTGARGVRMDRSTTWRALTCDRLDRVSVVTRTSTHVVARHWRRGKPIYDLSQLVANIILLITLHIYRKDKLQPHLLDKIPYRLRPYVWRWRKRHTLIPAVAADLRRRALTLARFSAAAPFDGGAAAVVWFRWLWHEPALGSPQAGSRRYLDFFYTQPSRSAHAVHRASLYTPDGEAASGRRNRRGRDTAHRLEGYVKLKPRVNHRHCVTPSLFVLPTVGFYDWFQSFFSPGAQVYDRVNPTYVERSLAFSSDATGAGPIKRALDQYADHPRAFRRRLRLMHERRNYNNWRAPTLRKIAVRNPWSHNLARVPWKLRYWTDPMPDPSVASRPDRVLKSRWPLVKVVRKVSKSFRRAYRIRIFRAKLGRVLRVVDPFADTRVQPSWMVLRNVPVCPPDIRPMVALEDQRMAVSDLNKFYQQILLRKNRQLQIYDQRADFCRDAWDLIDYQRRHYNFKDYSTRVGPDSYDRFLQKLTQQAVDNLIENGKAGASPLTASNNRPLKSLSDNLKGKRGRFRQNLLGKRVDYSGRSVIVVGPTLKLHECGLPLTMALVLFQHHVVRTMLRLNTHQSQANVKAMIQARHPHVLRVLKKLVESRPVLLNRAPTLHRLGVQAFKAKLVSGCAILLHPLVCGAFNADFDGDQMAVHVPVTPNSAAEAWKLMWGTNHLRSIATGDALLLPSQDMVLGTYYLTNDDRLARWKCLSRSACSTEPMFESIHQVERACTESLGQHTVLWLRVTPPLELACVLRRFETQITLTGTVYGLSPDVLTVVRKKEIDYAIKTTVGRALAHGLFRQSLA